MSLDPSQAESPATPNSLAWNYEVTVAEVEAIIHQIEAGELELADVFDQFAMAISYLRQCKAFLSDRQHQMNLLIEELREPQV